MRLSASALVLLLCGLTAPPGGAEKNGGDVEPSAANGRNGIGVAGIRGRKLTEVETNATTEPDSTTEPRPPPGNDGGGGDVDADGSSSANSTTQISSPPAPGGSSASTTAAGATASTEEGSTTTAVDASSTTQDTIATEEETAPATTTTILPVTTTSTALSANTTAVVDGDDNNGNGDEVDPDWSTIGLCDTNIYCPQSVEYHADEHCRAVKGKPVPRYDRYCTNTHVDCKLGGNDIIGHDCHSAGLNIPDGPCFDPDKTFHYPGPLKPEDAATPVATGINNIIRCNLSIGSQYGGAHVRDHCTTTVTVLDKMPPSITKCPGSDSNGIITKYADAYCQAHYDALQEEHFMIHDNCDKHITPTLTGDPTNNKYPKGTTLVTATAKDSSDNVDQCSFAVVVEDKSHPKAKCPHDKTVSTSWDSCKAHISDVVTCEDNCPPKHCPADYINGHYGVGHHTITGKVYDHSGNPGTCHYTVHVKDEVDPVVHCPSSDINVTTDEGVCTRSKDDVYYKASCTDNCGKCTVNDSTEGLDAFPKGSTEVTVVARDDSHNAATCKFKVNVNDEEAPRFTNCPTDVIMRHTDHGVCVAHFDPLEDLSAEDNCDRTSDQTLTVTSDAPADNKYPKGTTLVTATATDQHGNEEECTFPVVVKDGQHPQACCPTTTQIKYTSSDSCKAHIYHVVPCKDNCDKHCPGAHISGQYHVGQHYIPVTVYDHSGNPGRCHYSLEVKDNVDPTIDCPSDITVPTDEGVCNANVTDDLDCKATCTDNCGKCDITYDPENLDVFELGTTHVVATATDHYSNSKTCKFTVTVVDEEAPKFECPPDVHLAADKDLCYTNYTLPDIDATDNCRNVTVHVDGNDMNDHYPVSATPTTVTVTAKDDAGNEKECTFQIKVKDTQSPELYCMGYGKPYGRHDSLFMVTDNCDKHRMGDNIEIVICEDKNGGKRTWSTHTAPRFVYSHGLGDDLEGYGMCTAIDMQGNRAVCDHKFVPEVK